MYNIKKSSIFFYFKDNQCKENASEFFTTTELEKLIEKLSSFNPEDDLGKQQEFKKIIKEIEVEVQQLRNFIVSYFLSI